METETWNVIYLRNEETMQIGIFGFPKTGKTTLFNTLTGSNVATDAYSTGKKEIHMGMTKVPDSRLDHLTKMFHPKKETHAKIEYVDVVGVEKGESSGSDTFLNELKGMDALLHVVRVFDDPNFPHSQGSLNPKRDIENMEMELIFADLSVATRRVEKLQASLQKAPRETDRKELEALQKCVEALESEISLREMEFSPEELKIVRGFTFLSAKPLLIVLNISENEVGKISQATQKYELDEISKKSGVAVVPVSAKIELEISTLDQTDAEEFMKELGIEEPALTRLIRTSYEFLGLISFFTVGEDECRAWTIRKGTLAQQAAGTIHSDLERGFIRAEVVAYEDLMTSGNWNAVKEKGKLRLEGKTYPVQDGDILHVRFNV